MKGADTATATQAVNAAGFTSLTALDVFSRLYARNVMGQVRGVMKMKNKPPHPKFDVTLELTYQKSYCVRAKSQADAVEICKLRAQKRTKALKNLGMTFVSAKSK